MNREELSSLREQRARLRVRAVSVAVLCSGFVGITEILLGVIFHLASLLAEGVHTLADMFDSVVALWAVRKSSRRPDREHPYGHGKYESLAALIEGAVVGVMAAGICGNALMILITARRAPRLDTWVIASMAVASVVYWFVSRWMDRIARSTRSPAVFAEAAHLRTHIWITAGLFLGLGTAKIGSWLWLDAVLALGVGLVLARTAWGILRPALAQLTDRALPDRELRRIADELNEFRDEFVEIHAVRSRAAGADRHVDIHLVVDPAMTVRAAHDLCDRIESAIEAKFPDTELIVHVEPAWGQDAPPRHEGYAVHLTRSRPDEREDLHEDPTGPKPGPGP